MSTSEKIFRHGRDRNYTEDEYFELLEQCDSDVDSDDPEVVRRAVASIPLNPDVAMAFRRVYGKQYMLDAGFDLTEATMVFGEGWLDAPGRQR